MGAMAHFIMALLLLMQRREGERSRTILGVIVLVTVLNYAIRIFSVLDGHIPPIVISAPMLLVGIFMVSCYIMYPLEVVSPGWLNFRRVLKVFTPVLALTGLWGLTRLLGVEYRHYDSFAAMLPHAGNFDVWFRLLLMLLVFMPLAFIFFVPYTKKYNNTNRKWMWGYLIVFSINTLGYIAVLVFDSIYVKTGYYYISVGCELYIVYQELFVRLISRTKSLPDTEPKAPQSPVPAWTDAEAEKQEAKNEILFKRLEAYMHNGEHPWRDPDLSMSALVKTLYTNRTSLGQAIQEQGYENYSDYINRLRVKDFLNMIGTGASARFLDTFFDAGFRSKSTALRNFRQMIGMTPSEYFQDKHTQEENAPE